MNSLASFFFARIQCREKSFFLIELIELRQRTSQPGQQRFLCNRSFAGFISSLQIKVFQSFAISIPDNCHCMIAIHPVTVSGHLGEGRHPSSVRLFCHPYI
jgi:hypothetical protein